MLVKQILQHKQTQNNPEVKGHNVKNLSMNKRVYLLVPSGRVRNRGTSSTEDAPLLAAQLANQWLLQQATGRRFAQKAV